MKELKELLQNFGLTPATSSAIIIVIVVVAYFVKRMLDRRGKELATRNETLLQYGQLQEEAILKALRILYEERDLIKLSDDEFSEMIRQVDEMIMEPFTRYRSVLPEEIKSIIYNDIHSPIAQFKPGPSYVPEVSLDSKKALLQFKESFYKKIGIINSVIKKQVKRGII